MNANSSDVFSTFTASMCGLLSSPTVAFHSHAEYIEAHYLRHHRSASAGRATSFNVALYSDADGSHLTNDYAAALAVECQICIARAIGTITERLRAASDEEGQGGGGAPSADDSTAARAAADALEAERREVREMILVCHKPLLSALSLLMARFAAEESIQAILKCYQAFTQACAALELHQPRDAFLASLCNYALPPRAGGELRDAAGAISFAPVDTAYEPLPHTRLSAKNVQALKAVFNIAHCMGGLLGASWNLVQRRAHASPGSSHLSPSPCASPPAPRRAPPPSRLGNRRCSTHSSSWSASSPPLRPLPQVDDHDRTQRALVRPS